MPGWSKDSPRKERETVSELRKRLGLFSFQQDGLGTDSAESYDAFPGLGVRAGGIVEWLAAAPGAGAGVLALQVRSQPWFVDGVIALVDPSGECYAPALSGWGVRPGQVLFVRPTTRQETCWAIEECLRCSGVSATWAWIEERFSPRIHRRWQLAAEEGGGVGILFRPESARREPVWADLRVLVAPRPGGAGESRRARIDVLYRRGGMGGIAQVWEIDHAEGVVRLVPEVAHSAPAEREARA